MKTRATIFAFATLSAAALPGFASAQWSVNVIHPNGYDGSGAGGMSGGQLLGWSFPASQDRFQAGYWTSPNPSSFVNLHQAGWLESSANFSDGVHQYGYIRPDLATGYHAAMWTGTAASAVDLNPLGAKQSAINSVVGSKMGGWVIGNDDKQHGVIWDVGNMNSYVELTPAGEQQSLMYGMDGTNQVGHVGDGFNPRAALWSGTAASYVNLNSADLELSDAYATENGWQAGWGLFIGDTRPCAMLWNGTANSKINLNPTGSWTSALNGLGGGWQVGDFNPETDVFHAGLWHGTADSIEDLHQYLSGDFIYSSAISIELLPDVTNIYGFGITNDGQYQALIWSKPVPEPASMAALGLGIAGLLRRRAAKRAR